MGGTHTDIMGGDRWRGDGTRRTDGGIAEDGTGTGIGGTGMGMEDQGMLGILQAINQHLTLPDTGADQTPAADQPRTAVRQADGRRNGGGGNGGGGGGGGTVVLLQFNQGRSSFISRPDATTAERQRIRRTRIRMWKPLRGKLRLYIPE
jgi:hypothetical protein